jgi:hypothetical protein
MAQRDARPVVVGVRDRTEDYEETLKIAKKKRKVQKKSM